MAMNWGFIVAGLLVHLIFFYSIFDIYFTSPLVHGMTPQNYHVEAPAKRLVLFVADGLRADSFYEAGKGGESRAPFLRNVIETKGVWGVSHTRVPTESRPGHVALIAGFYEDVSAVAKGWKENPVEFDSVFNESRYTWSWGSPDILPMFAKGASGDHVFTHMYPAESEDFAGADASKLDTFVFDSVKDFLEGAKTDTSLMEKVSADKIVFFLHLLGIDVNGHSHKPRSREYLENIGIVDNGIEKTVKLIEEFYGNDDRTAYVFTADHGMTNWGSHGASEPSETMTPFVSWGAGVRTAVPVAASEYPDGLDAEWGLDHVRRQDVEQADLASLMSVLIGVPLPVNSVGRLPLDALSGDAHFKALCVFSKARQMLQQCDVSMRLKEHTTLSLLFTPYKPLLPAKRDAIMDEIEAAMLAGQYDNVIAKSERLISLAQEGLSYYHHYDRLFLGTSITLGFIGWTAYVVVILLQKHTLIALPGSPHRISFTQSGSFMTSEKGIRIVFVLVGSIIAFLLYVQSLPWTHYLYTLLPVIIWHKVTQKRQVLIEAYFYMADHKLTLSCIGAFALAVAALEIIVISFFYRQVLSIGLLGLAVWPVFTTMQHNDKRFVAGWVVSCVLLAVFPMLPPVGRENNYTLVCVAGAIFLVMSTMAILRPESRSQNLAENNKPPVVAIIQVITLVISICVVWSTSQSISAKQGSPLINQLLSWSTLACSLVLPLLCETKLYPRLLGIAQAWVPVYILLSMSHEGLFIVGLCALMFCWLHLENFAVFKKSLRLETLDFASAGGILDNKRKLWLSDVRMAYFFCFLLICAFFGTGNIASINSFDPASVYCFLTVFSPFTMGFLMLFKILIPFVLVACTFNGIHLALNVPTQSLFLLVLLMSDFMALHFFLLVRDYGSWLEIGTSISHYVIVMSLILFILLLLGLSQLLTSTSLRSQPKQRRA